PLVLGHPVDDPDTIATAIRIGNPASWSQAEAARDGSGGFIDSVTDDEILLAHRFLSREEGIFVEPGSAASVAGLLKTADAGRVPDSATIAVTVTGHGLKDPSWALHTADGSEIETQRVSVDAVSAARALGLEASWACGCNSRCRPPGRPPGPRARPSVPDDRRDRDRPGPHGSVLGAAHRSRRRARDPAGLGRRRQRCPGSGPRGQLSVRLQLEVPATSANLGPGYDAFGLALDIVDTLTLTVHDDPVDPESCVTVSGEGAQALPRDRSHLVMRVIAEVFAAEFPAADESLIDRIELDCRNRIPHS